MPRFSYALKTKDSRIVRPRIRKYSPVRKDAVKDYSYVLMFVPNDTGGYTVTCPSLPGLVTEGRTLREAQQHGMDALQLHVQGLLDDAEPLPDGKVLLGKFTIRVEAA